MNTRTRRALRATAAVAVACGLIGAQALVTSADASGTTTVTWTPSSAPALWSDSNCTSSGAAPSNTPSSPPSDAQGLAGTQTYVTDGGANSTGPSDVAWHYSPAAGQQGGPVVAIPASTTAMSIDIDGATSGRLLVVYNTTNNNQPVHYVGVWSFTTTSDWQTVTAGSLTWYVWNAPLIGNPGWAPANNQFVGLQVQNVPLSLASFFQGKTGTAQAAFELGCSGAFALDHLSATYSTGVTDYDAQTPTSTTTVTQGAATVPFGSSTTIAPVIRTTDGATTTTNPAGVNTLQRSVAGGPWMTAQTASPGSSFTVVPTEATQYRVLYSNSTLNPLSSTSNVVSVAVTPGLKLTASSAQLNANRAGTFTARVTPARSNFPVRFQQLSGTTWTSLGSVATNSSGIASLARARSTTGLWKIRAVVAARPGYLASTSNTVSIGVYQPVSISIYRSFATVYLGRSFRIYGTVTPRWAGIPLHLQQYVGGRWIAVATGRSGTGGAYSFTKVARYLGTPSFRVVAPASGYRRTGGSAAVRVTIVRAPVYTPPPTYTPPPSTGGGGGSGIG